MPVFAQDVLHGGARLQGFLLASIGVGAFAGAFVVASVRRHHGYGWPVTVGATSFCLMLMAFSMSRWVPLSMLVGFAIGASNSVYQTQNQAIVQIITPRNFRGRVLSIFQLDKGFVPLGSLAAGVLASLYGAPLALLMLSATGVILVLAISLLTPGFLSLKVSFQDQPSESAQVPPNGPNLA